jgi:GT2 family glycosyltransferase
VNLSHPTTRPPAATLPADLDITPIARQPIRLSQATTHRILERPVPSGPKTRGEPAASVIMVTFNNLVLTRLAVESVTESKKIDYELIIVDNDSQDGTRDYLQQLGRQHGRVQIALNERNLGFAAANNRGLALAAGRAIILLNNDTIVPAGWITALLGHLRDPAIGLVGATTNRIGNEAEVETDYRTLGEMEDFARDYTGVRAGRSFDISRPAMFCLAMRRDVQQQIGPLDEQFGVGLFEDDDYAMRARRAGYRTVCAQDCFVHHFGQASFGDLVPSGEYGQLFDANRRRFEDKWGIRWQPPRHGRRPAYDASVARVRAVAEARCPAGSTVVIVSKGDEALLQLDDRTGWHFPRDDGGGYLGHYPADSAAAIAHLEALRADGGQFLLFPASALWWLSHYREFAEHLRRRYTMVAAESDACTIFDLRAP